MRDFRDHLWSFLLLIVHSGFSLPLHSASLGVGAGHENGRFYGINLNSTWTYKTRSHVAEPAVRAHAAAAHMVAVRKDAPGVLDTQPVGALR